MFARKRLGALTRLLSDRQLDIHQIKAEEPTLFSAVNRFVNGVQAAPVYVVLTEAESDRDVGRLNAYPTIRAIEHEGETFFVYSS